MCRAILIGVAVASSFLGRGAMAMRVIERETAVDNAADNATLWGSSSVSKPVTASEREAFLQAHNMYRCMHGAGPVVWSDAVAESAAAYVAPLTSMAHSKSYDLLPPAGPAGENIYWSSRSSISPADVVSSWYEEVGNCPGPPESFTGGCQKGSGTTGHFTPIVWKGVSSIGCGWSNDGHLALCRYKGGDSLDCDVPNMGGCYEKQVGTRSKDETACGGSIQPPPPPPAPAPAPAPTGPSTGGDGGSCVTRQGCVFTSSGCNTNSVAFSFQCGPGMTFTMTIPDNYEWDASKKCASCTDAIIK